MLFTSIKEFIAAMQFLREPPDYAAGGGKKPGSDARKRAWIKIIMQIAVTLFCFGLGTFLYIYSPTDNEKKFGAFLIGTGVGFWLK